MRQHLEHLASALGVVVFALFISYFNTGAIAHVAPPARVSATLATLTTNDSAFGTTTIGGISFSPSTFESLFPTHRVTSTTPSLPSATTTPVKETPVVPRKVATKPDITSSTTPRTPVVTSPATSTSATSTPDTEGASVLAALENSIVNIICIANDGSLRSISGSGVIIDSRGIILTVAHVAQSALLQEYLGTDNISCIIRTGSPARSAYSARPIYVSEQWVKANATTLISSQPTGTGEYDYALLAITGSANGTPLPGAFPAVSLAQARPRIGDRVGIGSYGAQDLTSAQIRSSLLPTLVMSKIDDRFTFGENTIDVLTIAGSAASQEGSSGGAVVNDAGELIGIITTSEITGPVASREMRVITPSYIRRSYNASTGKDFDAYFGKIDLTTLVNVYAPTAQTLGQYVAHAIGL